MFKKPAFSSIKLSKTTRFSLICLGIAYAGFYFTNRNVHKILENYMKENTFLIDKAIQSGLKCIRHELHANEVSKILNIEPTEVPNKIQLAYEQPNCVVGPVSLISTHYFRGFFRIFLETYRTKEWLPITIIKGKIQVYIPLKVDSSDELIGMKVEMDVPFCLHSVKPEKIYISKVSLCDPTNNLSKIPGFTFRDMQESILEADETKIPYLPIAWKKRNYVYRMNEGKNIKITNKYYKLY